MNCRLPMPVRATAAALAVFVTTATLTSLVSAAGPQRAQWLALHAQRQAAQVAATLPDRLVATLADTNVAQR